MQSGVPGLVFDQNILCQSFILTCSGYTDGDKKSLESSIKERSADLIAEDESDPRWYMSNKLVGMMLYTDLFAGDPDFQAMVFHVLQRRYPACF